MTKLHPFEAQGTLLETNISSSTTVLIEVSFENLPTVNSPDFIELVFDPYNVYAHQERVLVTAHVAGSSTVAVTRGAYGSTASAHNTTAGVAEPWCCAPTDQDLVHANLTTLTTDDHPQYLLVNGSRPMTGTLTVPTVAGPGGALTLGSNTTVSATLSVSQNLQVSGNSTLGGNVTVNGVLNPTQGITNPCGRGYQNTPMNLTSLSAIPLAGISFNYGMGYTTYGLVVQTAGFYLVVVSLSILVAAATTVWVESVLLQNSVSMVYGAVSQVTGASATSTGSDIIKCAVGDVLSLTGIASTTSTLASNTVNRSEVNFISAVMVAAL